MQHQTIAADRPRQIEAQLDQDREALMTSIDALWNRFSLDRLWSDGASLIKSNAGPYTQALGAAVRANPMAVALTAVGLAWLILGRRSDDQTDATWLSGTKFEAEARWEDEGGRGVSDLPDTDAPWAEARWEYEGGRVSDLLDTDALWMEEADQLRVRASGMMSRINTALRDKLAPAAELANSRADIVASLTKDVRRVMARGLEGVVGTARDTAIAAREKAYMMRIAAGKVGAETVRDNPVVAGIALAVAGASVAALLPRSAVEDQLLGEPRDRLVSQAKRILKEERQRVAQTVRQAAHALTAEIAPSGAVLTLRHPEVGSVTSGAPSTMAQNGN